MHMTAAAEQERKFSSWKCTSIHIYIDSNLTNSSFCPPPSLQRRIASLPERLHPVEHQCVVCRPDDAVRLNYGAKSAGKDGVGWGGCRIRSVLLLSFHAYILSILFSYLFFSSPVSIWPGSIFSDLSRVQLDDVLPQTLFNTTTRLENL